MDGLIVTVDGRLVVTDEENFTLDINEYGPNTNAFHWLIAETAAG